MKRSARLAMALAVAAPLFSGLTLGAAMAGGAPTSAPLAALSQYQQQVPSGELNRADDDGERQPDDDGALLYVLPTYGVGFEYEGQVWTIEDEVSAANNRGRDYVQLESDQARAVLYVEATDTWTDAGECVDALSDEMLGKLADDADVQDIDVELSDLPDTALGAYIAEVEFQAGQQPQPIALVIECRAFEDGDGVVAFTMLVHEANLDGALEELEPLRQSVTFDVDPDASTADDDGQDAAGDDAESASFEGETFDFTYSYDPTLWEINDQQSTRTEDYVMFGGPYGSNLGFSVMATGMRTPESCVGVYADSFRELAPDLALYEDPDTGETVEFWGDEEAYALFTLTNENRGPLFVYLHCALSPDGEVMVALTGIAPQERIEFVRDEMMPAVGRIEF